MLTLSEPVRQALDAGGAVVALESTIIAHGLPRTRNLAVARELEDAVRAAGAVPATIAVLGGERQVADAELGDVGRGDALQAVLVEADVRLAAEHGDRRRHGAGRAHGVLELARDREVAWARQAVGDDRRLERDHRPAQRQRLGDLGRDVDHERTR